MPGTMIATTASAELGRTPDETYEGYRIFSVEVPVTDGWSAISEVEKQGADGWETFQQFGGPCFAASSDVARTLVLAESRRKIDDILARPRR